MPGLLPLASLLVPLITTQATAPAPETPRAEYERALNEIPSPHMLRAWHSRFGSAPHVAGTPGDAKVLVDLATAFKGMGLTEQANLIVAQKEFIAPQMTMLTVLTSWSLTVLVMVLGYAIYQALPDRKGEFGRFCDLRFGRVLAITMAVTSVLALFIGAEWIQNFAFVVFAIFWLQGLAVMHWLHEVGPLPFIVLVVLYAMLPFLNALLVIALAVLGYTDAWFDYRARMGRNTAR